MIIFWYLSHDSSEPSHLKRVYWDGGPPAIEHFLLHHLKDCPKNSICTALQLTTVEFEDSDSDENPTYHVSPKKFTRKSRNQVEPARVTQQANPLRIGM